MTRHDAAVARDVLVVGAGVAGLACARVLRSAGIRVDVVERRPGGPAPGLGLNLPGNAGRALGALGVAARVLASGVPITRREYRTARGRLLFAIDEAEFWAEVAPSVCIRPGALLDALAVGQDVRRGIGVERVDADSPRPRVVFDDGTEEDYDLVIGADGVHSVVRAAITGQETRASAMTAASWRFVVPNPGVDCWTAWTGRGVTLLLIPVSAGEVYGYATSSSRSTATGADPRWLAEAFARFASPARAAARAAAEGAGPRLHAPVEEVRGGGWHRGGVVLVGDAAHAAGPVWAQGAAAALEDALVLADELRAASDRAAALAAWERRRRPRVDHVQDATDRMSRLARLPAWLSHVLAPAAGPRAYRDAYTPLRQSP